MVVLQHRLKRWWSVPAIWPICFAVLFGVDLGTIDFTRTFDLFSLLDIFASGREATVVYPAMLPVLTAMLQSGLRTVTSDQLDPDSPLTEKSNGKTPILAKIRATSMHMRQRSMSMTIEPSTSSKLPAIKIISTHSLTRSSQQIIGERPAHRISVHATYSHEISGRYSCKVASLSRLHSDIELCPRTVLCALSNCSKRKRSQPRNRVALPGLCTNLQG